MFHKQGKPKGNCNSYRPISLLPTLSKIFERVILERLKLTLNEHHIVPSIQFGFREGHSTLQQLQRIVEIIECGYENKQYTVAVFLDITQAFDKVWIEGLKYKLLHIPLPHYLAAVIFSFLELRTFAVRINGTISDTKHIHAGVPQGSVLGPTLFNIFTNDIPTPSPSKVALFADDTAIISQHEELDIAIDSIQTACNTMGNWFTKWCITLNPAKCTAKIFTLKRISNHRNINLNNKPILWSHQHEAVKYLGVHLDTRLTWRLHINNKLNQGYNRLRMLYPLINRNTTMRKECTILLYKAILRPLVTYACPVWSASSKTNIKKLQVFQNKVLRTAINAPWHIRNCQIHYELGMETVEQFIKKLTKTFIGNLQYSDNPIIQQLGRKNIHTRLKRKLPQDIIQTPDANNESDDNSE